MTIDGNTSHVEGQGFLGSILEIVQERNKRETLPFIEIHNELHSLERQAEEAERRRTELERKMSFAALTVSKDDVHTSHDTEISSVHESAALRNERLMMEKLEKLEEELDGKNAQHEADTDRIEKTTKELQELKEVHMAQEKAILNLQEELDQKEKSLEHVTNKVEDSQQRTKLAEQQYVGLKETIRILQEENDQYQKDNRQLEQRLVSEKEKLLSELNALTDTVERLKGEADMVRNLQKHEEMLKDNGSTSGTENATTATSSTSSSSWFGFARKASTAAATASTTVPDATTTGDSTTGLPSSLPSQSQKTNQHVIQIDVQKLQERRKFGSFSVVIPSEPKQTIVAHHGEALCVRYDDSEGEFLATGGVDATINVWNVTNGSMCANFRAGSSNAILSCDLSSQLVACGGTDRMCRVFNVKTKRLVHQLVGHGHKITSVRFFNGEKGILTASADRRLKFWDISKQTYRQLNSIHLNSTANAVDVSFDSSTVATGHVDGGIRVWDVQTGQRTFEKEDVHNGAITSIQFHPKDVSKILTNGMDSKLRIVDMRSNSIIQQFDHQDFHTAYNWASSCFSPDGAFVTSGSSSNGHVFVWDVKTGKTVKQLAVAHEVGVCGISWGYGGASGQQVASVDKSGRLVFWA